MKKKILSACLAMALMVMMIPTSAFADGGGSFVDENGQTQTLTEEATVINADNIPETLGAADTTSWYIVQGDVTIGAEGEANYQRLQTAGDVRLILADGSSLTVYGGISLTGADGLTIYGQEAGTGKLVCDVTPGNEEDKWSTRLDGDTPAGSYAAIGGEADTVSGAITINGGTIETIGSLRGSGIGSGGAIGDAAKSGDITINGGDVTVRMLTNTRSSRGGAGIGGNLDNLTINDGKITVLGETKDGRSYARYGAAIGTSSSGGKQIEHLTINGGEISVPSDGYDPSRDGIHSAAIGSATGNATTGVNAIEINGGTIDVA